MVALNSRIYPEYAERSFCVLSPNLFYHRILCNSYRPYLHTDVLRLCLFCWPRPGSFSSRGKKRSEKSRASACVCVRVLCVRALHKLLRREFSLSLSVRARRLCTFTLRTHFRPLTLHTRTTTNTYWGLGLQLTLSQRERIRAATCCVSIPCYDFRHTDLSLI